MCGSHPKESVVTLFLKIHQEMAELQQLCRKIQKLKIALSPLTRAIGEYAICTSFFVHSSKVEQYAAYTKVLSICVDMCEGVCVPYECSIVPF